MTEGEIARIHQQIASLGDRMEKGFDEVKRMISKMDERVRGVENLEASCNPITQRRLSDIETNIRNNTEDIEANKKMIDALMHTNNILKWIIVIFSPVITALLIMLVTRWVGG